MKAEELVVGGFYVDGDGDKIELIAIKENNYIFWWEKNNNSYSWDGDSNYIIRLEPYTEPKPPVVIKGWVNVAWEYFSDAAYYDKWAIRNIGDKRFNAAIHVGTKEEAEFLTHKLNSFDALVEALETIKSLSDYKTGHPSQIMFNDLGFIKNMAETALTKARAYE